MSKFISIDELKSHFFDGMTMMSGGFMGCGAPELIIKEILEANIKDITLISTDTAMVDTGVGPLIVNGRIKKLYASHIGTNSETGKKMISGELNVELCPQGTLAERIRAGGSGLGGFLTPTGVGTVVEKGKQKITIDGVEYLLELPLKADIAIIKADIADEIGNLVFLGAARNFNPIMALAAKTVIVQATKIVKVGEMDPNLVMTPAAVVDYIVKA
ncbi:acetate CoA-transferase subunit alpha [Histophilus somni]|uniref:Acetate CoA-transferase subunit alpha n=1 Tax=Histophilus somni TaxID=731 RepID=A0AAX2S2H5_HISSO|nr:acetate CoA-transferase subunit alpha [Histophilus somni]TDF43105.1 acetate CoA-transferase subunit alpha [Histophilus somni]TEW29703.1 acetate CoA-transferase subunit alpha [Histophilus somni]TFF01440.1 acetate CoA-transferase subunit alpha [Histophilus somni]THA94279.1 acetate CoA-transferase subunit alpha [Histophilus somni]TJY51805.1 acetate CoA-transferase subunit alpha [Histophilus somni]